MADHTPKCACGHAWADHVKGGHCAISPCMCREYRDSINDAGLKPAQDRHADQFKPKTAQDIVNDVYRGGAAGHLTRANIKSILKGSPAFDLEPSEETAAECRRFFGEGWD